ncbi:unnamed protein product [Dicrocoelium dendriticum]|nr:unnamed protein product [Dicrocoelium dendriticum]
MAFHLLPPEAFWCDPATRPTESDWIQWRTSFTNYLDLLPATTTYDEKQKLKLLRHLLGNEGQRYFDALDLQKFDTLTKALDVLDQSWGARPNIFAERYKFCCLRQEDAEPLEQFVARLIRSVKTCDYTSIPKNKLESVMLTQQLITGIKDNRIREKLLSEDPSKLTWERAIEIARLIKAAVEHSSLFKSSDILEVSKIQHKGSSQPQNSTVSCYRCGSSRHKADCQTCPARTAECKSCGKLGHFARCCRSRRVALIDQQNDVSTSPTTPNVFSIRRRLQPETRRIASLEPKLPAPDIRTVTLHGLNTSVPVTMELDSASPITIIPSSIYDNYLQDIPLHPTSYKFESYTNSRVQIRGYIMTKLSLLSVASDVAVYVASEDSPALLGRNAMVALNITPSIERMRIMTLKTSVLKSLYPKLFTESIGRIPSAAHRICLKKDAKPFSISQPRPIPLAKRTMVEKAIQEMISNDLIEPVNCSEWVHPMVTVLKKDGTVRICNDLKALNSQIVVEKFVLPTVDELLVKITGARFFSKLDLRKAFFHMPLTPESRPLTAFLTSSGLFQYKVLPMGLSSAPAAWQKFMNHSLADLPGQIAYMDDICVFGKSRDEHDSRLRAVLQRLESLDLRLNLEKCIFCATDVEFLGYVLSAGGIRPCAANTRAITEAPVPKNTSEVKHFLGLCSYNLRYLPDFATIAEPLRMLTKEKATFDWGSSQQSAFEEIKRRLVSTPMLAIFDENCPTFVSTDASNIGLGAVLSQIQNGEEKVIAYASRKLSPTEVSYSAGEREALACVWACEKWHLFLFGRRFTLRTDHAALTTLLSRGTNGHRPLRINRWYARLLNYDFQIIFRPSSENRMADSLSRLPLDDSDKNEDDEEKVMISALQSSELSAVTKQELQEANRSDSYVQDVIHYLSQGWPRYAKLSGELRAFYVLRHELAVVDDCLMRGSRFVAPQKLTSKIIQCAHEGHPGIVRTKRRLQEYFWWPKMNKMAEACVRSCDACQKADKSSKPIDAPIQPVTYPMKPWSKVAIDIMGPFHSAPQHQRNCLVATCYYSKWPEIHLCGDVTTSTVIRWLKHLFARFGFPEEIVTDNGPQFTNYEFKRFLQLRDVKHVHTVPYNPAANGMVERTNRTLKETIQTARLSGRQWEDAVLEALFTHRTSHHRATDRTPGELMFGRKLRTKLNAAISAAENNDPHQLERRRGYQSSYEKRATSLRPGTLVRLKERQTRKGEPALTRPIRITRALGPGTYELADGRRVNARQLYSALQPKQCPETRATAVNQPLKRGSSVAARTRGPYHDRTS